MLFWASKFDLDSGGRQIFRCQELPMPRKKVSTVQLKLKFSMVTSELHRSTHNTGRKNQINVKQGFEMSPIRFPVHFLDWFFPH